MEILFTLVPLSIALITLAVFIFRWAVKSGQYDDLQGPAHSILFDDDKHLDPTQKEPVDKPKATQSGNDQPDQFTAPDSTKTKD